MSGRNCFWSVTLRSENSRAGLQRTTERREAKEADLKNTKAAGYFGESTAAL